MAQRSAASPRIDVFADVLTAEKLHGICGTQALGDVQNVEIVVDTTRISMDVLADFLPNLISLTLDNSRILSIRDLGTNLQHLKTLSLADVGLTELDGIAALANLRELRLANNSIDDLTPLAMHETLQILDMKNNEVDDFAAVEMLSTVPLL